MFPGQLIVPPITTTSFTRRKVSGSSAAAIARLVKGPTAIIVIVLGSFSRSSRKISLCDGDLEAVNVVGGVSSSFVFSTSDDPGGANVKSDFHESDGERCGC